MDISKNRLKNIFSNYSKVFENYFFTTVLQGANIVIGLLLYPYLIKTLGPSNYGIYVFVCSNITFFNLFISFGFTIPAIKAISLHVDDKKMKSETLSMVITAKCYLFLLSTIIFSILLFTIPFFRENCLLYIIVYSTLIYEILFSPWYFRGIQKIKIATYIILIMRLLTVPFIFIFVKKNDDLLIYALIVSLSTIIAPFISVAYIKYKEDIQWYFIPIKSLKNIFRDSLPFFWSSALGIIKRETVTLIIGTCFNMKDVALYDLANKIITIPRLITTDINGALFPKIVTDARPALIKKIIRFETFIGLIISLIIIVLGYWAVLVLGGKEMIEAYPLSIILSFTIFVGLIVGCYINYIFVPHHRYYFVTKNQFAALFSFIILCLLSLLFYKNLISIILAYTISGFFEIFYCKYLIKKHRLL